MFLNEEETNYTTDKLPQYKRSLTYNDNFNVNIVLV